MPFITLVSVVKKVEIENKTKYDTFYANSKAAIIINEGGTDYLFQSIYTAVMLNLQKSLTKCSSWIIDSIIDHTINI